MSQLTLQQIYNVANKLIKKGEDLNNYPIYLGNDDELNGIHNGWYINIIDSNDTDSQYFIEMIEDDRCTTDLKGKGILIS